MSVDSFIGLLGIAVSIVCTTITILVAPGLTVLLDRTVEFRRKRNRLLNLLRECEVHLGKWVHSTTREDWEEGRVEIFRLYNELGQIKEVFPVIGGGNAERSEIVGPGYPIGRVQGILLMMYLNSQVAELTEPQKRAREEDARTFSRAASGLARTVDRVEGVKQFRNYLLQEVWEIYSSLWSVVVGFLRGTLKS